MVDSKKALNGHIAVFKVFGLWPSINPTALNHLHLICTFCFSSLGFLITLLIIIPYMNSMKQVIDNLLVSCSVFLAGVKGIIVYMKQSKLQKLFKLIQELDGQITDKNEEEKMKIILNECKNIRNIFIISYLSAWIVLLMHSVWADEEKKYWSSTYLLPFRIAHNRFVYWSVLMFQAIANLCLCLTDAMTDTYGVILGSILGGHLDVLGMKLHALGIVERVVVGNGTTVMFNLIQHIQSYKKCLK